MDKLKAMRNYAEAFRAGAATLNTLAIAGDWFRSGQQVETAIAWANYNYLPEEALPLIDQGMTPELADAGDEALIEEHGLIGAAILKLQLAHPGADILVDPDVEEPQR